VSEFHNVLRWYFQIFHSHGFDTQVSLDSAEVLQGLKKIKDLQMPLKLALFISPIALLSPYPLANLSFVDVQLIEVLLFAYKNANVLMNSQIYRRLGSTKPADIEHFENTIIDEILMSARGVKTVEKAFADFLANAGEIHFEEESATWFGTNCITRHNISLLMILQTLHC
jgi:hypothetical protein